MVRFALPQFLITRVTVDYNSPQPRTNITHSGGLHGGLLDEPDTLRLEVLMAVDPLLRKLLQKAIGLLP